MDEKSNTPVVPQVPEETERIGATQISDNQESSLDTPTAMSSSDYFKAQNDQPVIDNSSGLTLWEKDLADDDDFFRYIQEDEKLKAYQMEMRDTSSTSGVNVVPAIIDETPMASTDENLSTRDLDTLTVEITQYLNVARYSVIEVGKRLILAKKLVPHGQWATWLKDNFNLKQSSAKNFMAIARRFSNRQSIGDFDISTFKPTQLIALLALHKGEEINFIETMATEGKDVAEMSVKNLRSEIKKRQNAVKTHEDTIFTQSVHEQAPTPDTELDATETFANPNNITAPLNTGITNDFSTACNVDKSLAQLFAAASSLLHADNLQSVVSSSADNDLQSLELQLSQLAAIHDELTNYLTIWKESKHKKDTIDNTVVSSSI